MKVTSHLLVALAMMLGSACSTSSTTGTSGASTGGSSPTDASGSGGMYSSSGTAGNASATGGATGSSGTGGATGTSGAGGTGVVGTGTETVGTGDAGTSGTAGTGTIPEATAFMATFATMDDATFLLTAASSNQLEIQLGQLAAQQGSNANVKKFGQMMNEHHGKATQQLTSVATPLGVKPSTALMPVHQTMMDQVKSKTGKQFDEAYMDAMETAHKMDIALFEAKSRNATNPSVKTFATKTLPMLRSHETMANNLEKQVD